MTVCLKACPFSLKRISMTTKKGVKRKLYDG